MQRCLFCQPIFVATSEKPPEVSHLRNLLEYLDYYRKALVWSLYGYRGEKSRDSLDNLLFFVNIFFVISLEVN